MVKIKIKFKNFETKNCKKMLKNFEKKNVKKY